MAEIGGREVRQTEMGLALRASRVGSKSPGTMVGYAAVFDTFSCDLGSFREKIARGAFDKALARSDVRALYNHDPNLLLGRTAAGTLRLFPDAVGLRMELDLPDTQLGQDTAVLTRRGDLQGQSFSFTTVADHWDYSTTPALRTLLEVGELFDVGPVTFPAYEDSSVAMRKFEAGDSWRSAPRPGYPIAYSRDLARLRLLEVFGNAGRSAPPAPRHDTDRLRVLLLS